MSSKPHILTVLTPDRAGIIAGITQVLNVQNIHISEMSQTVVRNYFTIIVVLELPDDASKQELIDAVQKQIGADASVTLVELKASQPSVQANETYVLTLVGAHETGVLAAISSVLAGAGGNIIDFSAQSNQDGMQIIAEVRLPAECAVDQLQIDLQHANGEQQLQARLQHQRLFQATNEIAFRRIDHV